MVYGSVAVFAATVAQGFVLLQVCLGSTRRMRAAKKKKILNDFEWKYGGVGVTHVSQDFNHEIR